MFITKAALEQRLTSTKNVRNLTPSSAFRVVNGMRDRSVPSKVNDASGDKNGSHTNGHASALVAALATASTPKEVAKEFGIDPASVKQAMRENKPVVEETKERVSALALDKLMETLGLIEPIVTSNDPKAMSVIAANLSRVVTNLAPKEKNDTPAVSIVFYSPAQRAEKDFTVIEA